MASAYSSPVTASQVGSYFVQQYYQVYQQQPEYVHQFYTDSSTIVRVDGESTQTASALFQIHTLIQSLHFSAIEIKTINSHESWREGIVVVVSGSVRSNYFSGWRKFVQTFFLAPQEKGYFVMNDIFHFVSDDVTNHLPPPSATRHIDDFHPINSTSPWISALEAPLEAKAGDRFNSIPLNEIPVHYYRSQEHQHQQQDEEEDDSVDDDSEEQYEEEPPFDSVDYYQEPLQQNAVERVQEPVHQDTVERVQEPLPPVEEPARESVKFTYASIRHKNIQTPSPALQSKGKTVPSVPTQAAAVKTIAPATEWHQPSEPVATFVTESSPYVTEETLVNEEGESKSVYVRNLPTTVTSLEILQEFKNFGRIKEDGVFLKNRKDVGICFAFVEFEDLSGVQKAIEASPIQLAGRQVYIEERRANGSSSSSSRGGRGRGGRGRGSYDSSRGRYGGAVANGRGNGYRNF